MPCIILTKQTTNTLQQKTTKQNKHHKITAVSYNTVQGHPHTGKMSENGKC